MRNGKKVGTEWVVSYKAVRVSGGGIEWQMRFWDNGILVPEGKTVEQFNQAQKDKKTHQDNVKHHAQPGLTWDHEARSVEKS